ncbi:hypothetical protein [Streptomyces sp. NBC_01497]|uniref:hypothetical protein n=1 Tax=Streptomyces sp. NBC_01497 TaxID=2903885 RepID=UPI002E36FEEF|nr:hypothetical protein [Streptomyces sp. NBC_01497]
MRHHPRRTRRSNAAVRPATPGQDTARRESPVLPLAAGAGVGGLVVLAAAVQPVLAQGTLGHVESALVAFLDFFVGVFTLLALTATVVCGLLAAYRSLLTPKWRVLAQQAHRGTAVAALGCLVVHIAVKVGEGHISLVAALLPFAGGTRLAVGLGVSAAYLMVIAAITGAVRGRFAARPRPGTWRVLHATAYVCWAFGLAHGLAAGRPAKPFVLWGYGICAGFVLLVLLVRVLAFVTGTDGPRRARTGLRAYEPRAVDQDTLDALDALSLARPGPGQAASGASRTGGSARPAHTDRTPHVAVQAGAFAGAPAHEPYPGGQFAVVQERLFDTGQIPLVARHTTAHTRTVGQFTTGSFATGQFATGQYSGGRYSHDTGGFAAAGQPPAETAQFAATQQTFFDTGQFATVRQPGHGGGFERQAVYDTGAYGAGFPDAPGTGSPGTGSPGVGSFDTGSPTVRRGNGQYGTSQYGTSQYGTGQYATGPVDPGRLTAPSYQTWAWVPGPGDTGAAGGAVPGPRRPTTGR